MSHLLTFADSEFNGKRRKTRKEIFLARMEDLLPWAMMQGVIEQVNPKAGNGRRPYPLDTMLRIHCMQQWYNLSDGAMEDALYEIASMRLFAKLSLDQAIPDRTTIMNFRHLLELHQLARQFFEAVNQWLADAGYQGAEKREELNDVKVEWAIAMRPGKLGVLKKHPRKNKAVIAVERLKSSIRAKVEHPFRIIKCQFGFVKARFKGLRKNDNQLAMLFTLANLFRVDQMIRAWDSCAQKSK